MKLKLSSLLLIFTLLALALTKPAPVNLYLIGDSTVKTGSGKGENGQWGWGSFLPEHFDTTRIKIHNHAIGGRSSRTFVSEGRWDKVLSELRKGDYLLIQFGHNDSSPVNDTLRARGTIKGIGEETEEIDNLITKKHEVVHSYGWYLRKYIDEAKAKGAIPIVCSPIPRNQWENGRIVRPTDSYPQWAQAVAKSKGAYFIDLYELVATEYDRTPPTLVKQQYFTPADDTHTSRQGGELNAELVARGIKTLKKCSLKKYLK
ncbi:rhamnogalacturonan acetylesterase [Telluribacter sp. SYSU D00476]|uniref:rhamnogalacturonan acetylesterase n=1 Tax=Telluribacter sp. SYSU D00476 TaxID=2811430 RepID=UPI001FF6B0D8|nr:rhamnogalacturonan acetylesterase [Telluribacter sp. SYSU D00476]